MNIMKYFFGCYFNESMGLGDLEEILADFKNEEKEEVQLRFVKELHAIIDMKKYEFTSKLLRKYVSLGLTVEETEKFIKFLYDRIVGIPTDVKPEDFFRNCKTVVCPVCTPDLETAHTFSLVYRATIISNDQVIYICKPCKLVWLTDEIKTTDPQPYKKYMKKLGLNGTWKELKDVDYL